MGISKNTQNKGEFLFGFKAISPEGKVVEDTVTASDVADARRKIRQKGLTPVNIKEKSSKVSNLLNLFAPPVDNRTVALFCAQLHAIVSSGINILTGINLLSRQSKDKNMKKMMKTINEEIQKGKTISEAMDSQKTGLPSLLINMISVGEISGNLEEVLGSMAVYYEKEASLRSKLKGAMVYPVVLLVVGISMLVFFLNFVLPEIMGVIIDSGQKLPLITKFVLGMSNLLQNYGIQSLIGIIIALILVKVFVPKKKSRIFLSSAIMYVPQIGSVVQNIVTSRFLRTMSIMLSRGIPMIDILETLENTLSNALAENAVRQVKEGVLKGEKFSDNLMKSGFFDPMIVEIIGIGEETGQLDSILNKMSIQTEKEADESISKLVAAIEPMFTVIIGVSIAILVVSMLLPMFGMVSTMRPK